MFSSNFKTQAPSSGPVFAFEQATAPVQGEQPDTTFAEQIDQALGDPPPTSDKPNAHTICISSGTSEIPAQEQTVAPPVSTASQQKPAIPGRTLGTKLCVPNLPFIAETETAEDRTPSAGVEVAEDSSTVNLDSLCSMLLLAGLAPQVPAVAPTVTTQADHVSDAFLCADAEAETLAAEPAGYIPSPAATLPQPLIPSKAVEDAPELEKQRDGMPNASASTLLKPETLPKPENAEPASLPTPPVASPPEAKFSPSIPIHGTATAKRDLQMKKTAENLKLSPERDQSLPPAATLSSSAAVSAVATFNRKEERLVAPLDAYNGFSLQHRETIPTTEVVSTAAPEAPASLERVEQTILNSAIELKRLGKESMSVVLRPDQQTEMHLNLVVSNGRVDVEARVSRGDLAHLQSHWSALQQNLALQGVRLQSIEESRDIAQQGGGGFGGSSHFTRQDSGDSRRRDALLEAELNNLPLSLAARTNAARRLWESWA